MQDSSSRYRSCSVDEGEKVKRCYVVYSFAFFTRSSVFYSVSFRSVNYNTAQLVPRALLPFVLNLLPFVSRISSASSALVSYG